MCRGPENQADATGPSEAFSGPLAYGELPEGAVDISEDNDAPTGGAELQEGDCYQISVISETFQIGSTTLIY